MPALDFTRFDPACCAFPKPVVGLLPQTGSGRLGSARDARWKTVLDDRQVIHYVRGRYALRECYRQGVSGKGAVFLPSYHCRTMVDPALDLGLKAIFFPLAENLSPDLSALGDLFRAAGLAKGIDSSVLVVPHYFGFRQSLTAVKSLCAAHGVLLVEDCSHALITGRTSVDAGSEGDFLIASPYKFFGSEDGGALLYRPLADQPGGRQQKADWLDECKAWARLAVRLARPSRAQAPNSASLADKVGALQAHPGKVGVDVVETVAAPSSQFRKADAGRASLSASRWLMAHTDIAELARARRENYTRWLACIEGLLGCRPLFPVLPEDCVPYMFPVILDDPETHFYLLKRLGVPVGRWDELAISDCPVARRYRLGLVHLPCHQGLDFGVMAWLTAAFAETLRVVGSRAA